MTKILVDEAALRQALETLENLVGMGDAETAITALRAALDQPKPEPVAWMNHRNGFIVKENRNRDYNVPLFALEESK